MAKSGRSRMVMTLLSAAAIVGVDQLAKVVVRVSLSPCTHPPASACDQVSLLGHAVSVLRMENAGSALGVRQGLWLWTGLALFGLGIALALSKWSKVSVSMALAAGLLVGGSLGNVADRLILGQVTDFLTFAWGPERGIGINGADLALLVGAVIATGSLYRCYSYPARVQLPVP
jgi:signal peptidase II